MRPYTPHCTGALSAWLAIAILHGSLHASLFAGQDKNPFAIVPTPPSPAPSTNAPVKQVGDGLYEVGRVRLDKKQRTITFPAVINMRDGVIEYLIVTESGKTHESLLRTATDPLHLQVAMLLLGAKGAQAKPLTEPPPEGPIKHDDLAKEGDAALHGESVTIEVLWKTGGKDRSAPIEEFVLNLATKNPMTKGPFIFNGSRVWDGKFIAQIEGSIVSTITDPDAMFNNPRPGHDRDDIWKLITSKIPPLDSEVQVTVKLEPPKTGKD